jgi:hypothetical protein
MSNFEFFSDFSDFSFEISKRSALNLKVINEKLKISKTEPFIIDISINGFSSKDNFDFNIGEQNWKSVSHNFVKGKAAQDDNAALTVKRAIRVMAVSTSSYIEKNKVIPYLHQYNTKLTPALCHLGAHFVVKDNQNAQELYELWCNFDEQKKITKISDTVYRILSIRNFEIKKREMKK